MSFRITRSSPSSSNASSNRPLTSDNYEEAQSDLTGAPYNINLGSERYPNEFRTNYPRGGMRYEDIPFDNLEKPIAVEHPSIRPWYKKKRYVFLILLALVLVIAAAVLIPVGLLVIKPNSNSSKSSSQSTGSGSSSGSSGSGSSSGSSSNSSSSSGSSGDSDSTPSWAKNTVLDISTWYTTTDFNTTFTNDTVGELSIMGLNSTWDDSARANSHVPALDEAFNYTENPIRGVNLGGWLIIEPFITPSYFEKYSLSEGIVDEYSLSEKLGDDLQNVIEKHYATWITEKTFSDIRAAGLDHVRIPYPYWAVGNLDGDPYLEKVSWRYLLRAIEYARKYGLRVFVDLHSVPGNANGWNHSGHQGSALWLNGTKGDYYGDLTLELHRKLAKFFAQDRYKNIVTLYGLVNEPNMLVLNSTKVIEWTKKAYDISRDESYENYIVFGDGFRGVASWEGVFNESEYPKMILDVHQYMIFDTGLIAMSHSAKINYICDTWTADMQISTNVATGHGPTIVGEWSQADTDCLLYLNNVGVGSRWEGTYNVSDVSSQVLTPSCPVPSNCTCDPTNTDPDSYDDAYREYLLMSAESQMTAFESNGGWGFMYWTWRTETTQATQWSYERGMKAGILPKLAYQRTYNCSATAGTPDFVSLGLAENY
ncbi:glycoside hydrolase [Lipomyces oligophaga]|uniref:glycoside hydrolase n=1 Tax=Lipomyces oligophaga TaxID=45792 RepID=UPI0034CE7FEA